MGYYIPNDIPIAQRDNVRAIDEPTSLDDVAKDEAIICEIDNMLFKANGFAYSQDELEAFLYPDGRPRKWFKMPLAKAKELSGFKG